MLRSPRCWTPALARAAGLAAWRAVTHAEECLMESPGAFGAASLPSRTLVFVGVAVMAWRDWSLDPAWVPRP